MGNGRDIGDGLGDGLRLERIDQCGRARMTQLLRLPCVCLRGFAVAILQRLLAGLVLGLGHARDALLAQIASVGAVGNVRICKTIHLVGGLPVSRDHRLASCAQFGSSLLLKRFAAQLLRRNDVLEKIVFRKRLGSGLLLRRCSCWRFRDCWCRRRRLRNCWCRFSGLLLRWLLGRCGSLRDCRCRRRRLRNCWRRFRSRLDSGLLLRRLLRGSSCWRFRDRWCRRWRLRNCWRRFWSRFRSGLLLRWLLRGSSGWRFRDRRCRRWRFRDCRSRFRSRFRSGLLLRRLLRGSSCRRFRDCWCRRRSRGRSLGGRGWRCGRHFHLWRGRLRLGRLFRRRLWCRGGSRGLGGGLLVRAQFLQEIVKVVLGKDNHG